MCVCVSLSVYIHMYTDTLTHRERGREGERDREREGERGREREELTSSAAVYSTSKGGITVFVASELASIHSAKPIIPASLQIPPYLSQTLDVYIVHPNTGYVCTSKTGCVFIKLK